MILRRRARPAGLAAAGAALALLLPAGAAQAASPSAPVAAVRPAQAGDGCAQRALVPETTYLIERLGLDRAWGITRGDGAVVAVVDSGVQAGNVHFGDALAPGISTGGSGDAGEDLHGHGTVIAGLIGARPVDGSGVIGIAPEATILPVRAYEVDASEAERTGRKGPSVAALADGIRRAADAGADVVNVSLSNDADPGGVLAAAVAHAQAQGALVVASAGNRRTADEQDPPTRFLPAELPGVLGVSAVSPDGTWDASASFTGEWVDVTAPGQSVSSAFPSGGDCIVNGDYPSSSYATAVVSGVAALVAAAHPDETPAQWAHRILASAQRPDPDRRTDTTGWGEARPFEALNLIDDGLLPGPDSPTRGEPLPEDAPAPIALDAPEDPAGPARAAVAWALLGGTAVSLIALLLGTLGDVRRRARR